MPFSYGTGLHPTILGAVKRLLAVLAALLMLAPAQALASPVGPLQLAQEEQPAEPVEEGSGDEVDDDARQPAVVFTDDEGVPDEEAWTFRFLVPTLLVLTVFLVIGLLAAYQLRLKRRYKVAE